MANSIQHMPKQNLTRLFSIRHTQPLCSRTPDGTSALCSMGALFKTAKLPTKKHKDAENVALNRLPKGHVFTLGELKQEGNVASFALC